MTREVLEEKMKDLPNPPCRVNLIQQVWEIMNSETEELEKENALLKGRNEEFEQQIMGLLIKYEEVYKRFPDLKSAMDKAKAILKENAELKEHIKADCIDCADYIKNKKLEKQLEQAKKYLEECVYNVVSPERLRKDIEQFLKE